MDTEARRWREQARDGDAGAATELINAFYGRLYAFLRRLAGNETEACDLTQLAFSRIWKALPSFAGRSSVSSWMHAIAYRTYVDWLRSSRRTEERSDAWWEACATPEADPAERASANDLSATLFAAVDQLEPDLRATVHLRYYQGLTLEETAESLGIAASSVKYRLTQALAKLQTKLREDRTPLLQPTTRPQS